MRLCLSKNKKIAGVCGGLAQRFGLDASLVRVIAVLLLLLLRTPVLVVYVLLWAIMPSEV